MSPYIPTPPSPRGTRRRRRWGNAKPSGPDLMRQPTNRKRTVSVVAVALALLTWWFIQNWSG